MSLGTAVAGAAGGRDSRRDGSGVVRCAGMTNLAGLDILLVEDDVMLRKRLLAQLERLGAEVTAAETLQAARQFLATLDFDFALLDVNLPDGFGSDLLKQRTFGPGTGVIVMTAHGGVAGAVEAMRLGALDYLVKPFEAEEVPLVIERARRARQTTRVEEHRRDATAKEAINLPIFLQEMVMAVWLIVKGFSASPIAAESVAVEKSKRREKR